MKTFNELREILNYRMTENPDNYFTDTLWEQEVGLVCADMEKTIRFIQIECTDEELWWFCEVLDDIVEKTRSDKILNCVRERAVSVKNKEWKAQIIEDIETASMFLE